VKTVAVASADEKALLRSPPFRLASVFLESYRFLDNSVGANFSQRWERCFSVRSDVAQRYAEILEESHYSRSELNRVMETVYSFVRGTAKVSSCRSAFSQYIAQVKTTIHVLSDGEPAAVLPDERRKLEAAVKKTERAFDDFATSLALLGPIHLLLQRHFDLLRLLTLPGKRRDALYQAGDTDDRARLDRAHEKAVYAHHKALLPLAAVRDELFIRVTPEGVHRYIEEADRLDARNHPFGVKKSARHPDDQSDLCRLRDELEVSAVMLELDDEKTT